MNLASLVLADGEFRVIRCDVIDRLLNGVDGDAALLYLYALRHDGKFKDETAMRALHMQKDQFERALFTLNNLVVANQAVPMPAPRPAMPKYTPGELREARQQDQQFTQLCDAAEGLANRALTESFLRTLYSVYEHMKLPADVIFELLVYVKGRDGALKPREVLKEATQWADRGILSLHDAQEHLSKLEAEKPLLDALYAVLGVVGRTPIRDEENLVRFCAEKGFPPEALELAKARMQRQNIPPSFNYLTRILRNWDEKGVHTLSEITTAEPEYTKKPSSATPPPAPAPAPTGQLEDWEKDWLAEVQQRKRAQMEGFA